MTTAPAAKRRTGERAGAGPGPDAEDHAQNHTPEQAWAEWDLEPR
ncbi:MULTISPECIES: hypothetical protein [unclassified Streptomyces]|nr:MULTISPECIES: hypothetical protein [unclassified Streptomyces]